MSLRVVVRVPVPRRQVMAAAGAGGLVLLLAAATIGILPLPGRAYPGALGAVAILAWVLTTGYIVFLRSQNAVVEVRGDILRFRATTLPLASMTWRVRTGRAGLCSRTALELQSGTERLTFACRGRAFPVDRVSVAVMPRRLDGLTNRADLVAVTRALARSTTPPPEGAVPRPPRAMTPVHWLLGLIITAAVSALISLVTPSTKVGTFLSVVLWFCAISAGVVASFSDAMTRQRRQGHAGFAPSIAPLAPGPTAKPRSFWSAAFRLIAIVTMVTLIPIVLLGPSYATIKAFERRVDVPGCRNTCQQHQLTFDSYSSTKSGRVCLCRSPDNREGWRVFDDRYNVLGGDSGWGGYSRRAHSRRRRHRLLLSDADAALVRAGAMETHES
jgi:hypothetical protein